MNHVDQNTGSPQTRNEGPKKNKRIQIMAVLFIFGGVQAATQYFAYIFEYQPQLGGHFNQLYAPWSIIEWGSKWYSEYPDLFQQSASVGVVFAGAGLVLTLVMKMVSENSSRPNKNLHGSARWANLGDIQAARLLPATQSFFKKWATNKTPQDDYVYVGAWEDKDGTPITLNIMALNMFYVTRQLVQAKGLVLLFRRCFLGGRVRLFAHVMGRLYQRP